MLLIMLKVKNKVYFESIDDQNHIMDVIESIENKFGTVEFDKSVIIRSSKEVIEEVELTIEENFYLHVTRKAIDEKVYRDVITFIDDLGYDVEISRGIEIENYEDDTPTTFDIYFYIDDNDEVTISLDKLDIPFSKEKSFITLFENNDNRFSIFKGFINDLSELIIESSDRMFTTQNNNVVEYFISTKLGLMKWKNIPKIVNMNGTEKKLKNEQKKPKNSKNSDENEYFTAKEVLSALRISDQTLANWRKKGLIEFKQLSARKYLYHRDVVWDILENGIKTTNKTEVVKKSNKTKTTKVKKKSSTTNFEGEILKLLHPFVFKVTDYKYKKQNFFLNFGNIGINSSPQVMINNDFQLVDFIKKDVIYDNAEDLLEYLTTIFSDGKTPSIDSSKMIQREYSMFYLNNLRKQYN